MKKLIGIYSSKAQSGKSEVAKYLTRHGYVVMPFAYPIKQMAGLLFKNVGYSEEEAAFLLTKGKKTVLPELGVSVRHVLRTLGTEWGRQQIHSNVWLLCWERSIKNIPYVVVDDVRFANEAELIKKLGGVLWRVHRERMPKAAPHLSEGGLDDYTGFDVHIPNNGTLADLLHYLGTVER